MTQLQLSKKSSSYSKESATKIKSFFKATLGDYNGQNGVEFRKLPKQDTLVLLSGKDLKAVKQLEEKQRQTKKDVNKSKTTQTTLTHHIMKTRNFNYQNQQITLYTTITTLIIIQQQ